MNFDSKENPGPCSACALMYLVPPQARAEKIPCRHIPLNDSGETLDSLYRYSSQAEIEETVEEWLQTTIRRLEEQRMAFRTAHDRQPTPSGEHLKGTPLYEKQHPKCANPACPTAFHWTGGGKFFRFHPDPPQPTQADSTTEPTAGIHGVRHYWLCERCSHSFTLAHEEGFGVTLSLLWPELSLLDDHKEVSAT